MNRLQVAEGGAWRAPGRVAARVAARISVRSAGCAAACAAGACHGTEADLAVSELAPLEPNRAPLPEGTDADPFPEDLAIVSGGEGKAWWAHGRGYIHADPGEVWAVARVPEVGVDRRAVAEWSVTYDPVDTLDASYRVQNVVHDVVTVEYELWWRHELQAGTVIAPELVVARWDKTTGTMFIDQLAGSLVLSPVEGEPAITEVDLIQEFEAPMRDDATMVAFLEDFHASLVAAAHGEPLPTY